MLAREGTSCGASSWWAPWRARKAMGIGRLPAEGEWCTRMEMGEEGRPQGVGIVRVAATVKPGRCWIPVPPMTAMRTGSGRRRRGGLVWFWRGFALVGQ
jgi:hypothetical protein